MKLELKRDTFTDNSTIGKLHVNGVEFCETLEDRDRRLEEGGLKVYAKTCIPRGVYETIIDYSNRFKVRMPHILKVPQFEGVRIHPGNADVDTEGCILVGMTRGVDFIGDSRKAYYSLFRELEEAILASETIEIIVA